MLEIHRYRQEDNDAVKALHYSGLEQFDADAGVETDMFLDEDLDEIEDHYIRNSGEFLVGFCDGILVAMCAVRKSTAVRGEIKRLRVHPDYQRRGFGEKILVEVLDAAARLGYTELFLNTSTQMVPARTLYQKYGFIEGHREKIGRQEVILYEKKL